MRNFIQTGDVITVPAPYAVSSGQGVLVGALFGIATCDAASGAAVEIKRQGVFDVAALSTDTGAIGVKVYWDNTNRRITVTAGSNTLVGALTDAKTNGVAAARVLLDGAVR
jgi:predicted RecA/RadA family phage recombinase